MEEKEPLLIIENVLPEEFTYLKSEFRVLTYDSERRRAVATGADIGLLHVTYGDFEDIFPTHDHFDYFYKGLHVRSSGQIPQDDLESVVLRCLAITRRELELKLGNYRKSK